MKKLLSALLCLLVLSSCNLEKKENFVVDLHSSDEEETVELRETDEPKAVISFDDLDDFSFVIEVDGYITTVTANNINGSKSMIYVASPEDKVIYELNTKGGSKLFHKDANSDLYNECSIEYSDFDFDALYELLSYVGIDFKKYYGKSKFTLQSETDETYVYSVKCDEGDLSVHIDKKTGIWLKVVNGDEIKVKVKDFSLTKGVIPNH